MNYIPTMPEEEAFECAAKFRYRQSEQAVRVMKTGADTVRILFKEPQRAVTEGQYAVLYNARECLGGGVIIKTF